MGVETFYDCECFAETELCALVIIEGEKVWVLKSQIHDDSEVYKSNTQGTLIVSSWWARKEGLV